MQTSVNRLKVETDEPPTRDDVAYALRLLIGEAPFPVAATPLGDLKRQQLARVVGWLRDQAILFS